MFVYVNDEKCEITGNTVSDALKAIGVNVETVLVRKDGKLITEKDTLNEGDKIETLSIISGG